jgi:DNA polymerase-3 subunit gamma/tau
MENYIVSARKYRPQVFDEVVGQSHVTNTLFNAIKNNHLAQALLFTGPRGVGKTTSARILAKLINAEDHEEGDDDYSFNIFELDAASNNSVDDIRSLIDQVRFAPQRGKFKVYIIDEVHMLSQQAFNAFLKTLEEPPKHAIFILATTEKHKIIPTILSRCQIYDFKRISVEDIIKHLQNVAVKENIQAEEQALRIIAQKADGALRDALSIFDRIASYSGSSISYQDVIDNLRVLDYDYYFRTLDLILSDDKAGLFNIFDEILENGFDGHIYINGLAAHCRDLLVCQNPSTLKLLEVGKEIQGRYELQSKSVNASFLLRALKIISEADVRYKSSSNARLLVELLLMELAATWSKLTAPSEKKKSNLDSPQASEAVESGEIKHITKPVLNSTPSPVQGIEKPQKVVYQASNVPVAPAPLPPTSLSAPITATSPKLEEVASPLETKSKTNAPSPLKRKASFSITQTLQGKNPLANKENVEEEEDLDAPVSGKPQKEFNLEELQKVWLLYLEKAKADRQRVTLASLSNKPLAVDGSKVTLTLDNTIQEQNFQDNKRDLLYFLREKLDNYAINITIKIVEGTQTLEPYSPQEKYQHLLEKNPLLNKLKTDLNLEIQ